jgi:hypothetical protein
MHCNNYSVGSNAKIHLDNHAQRLRLSKARAVFSGQENRGFRKGMVGTCCRGAGSQNINESQQAQNRSGQRRKRTSAFYRVRIAMRPGVANVRAGNVSAYQDYAEELENTSSRWERLGKVGAVARSIDRCAGIVGQHGVYCQSARQPGKPAMDVQLISRQIADAKELIIDVMRDLKPVQPGIQSAGHE